MPGRVRRLVVFAISACLAATGPGSATAAGEPPAEDHTTNDEIAGWQRLWHPAFEPRIGDARTSQLGVERVGERFAIVGGDHRGAVVWWSDDGLQWERSHGSDATERGEGFAIAGEPGRYVMAGTRLTPLPRARLWHSSDGLEWVAASTKLPPDSRIAGVATLGEGSFVAFGESLRRDGGDACWMASSADGGATWDVRWPGEWDPGYPEYPEGCVNTVTRDGDGLVGRVGMGISESADGIGWSELVSAREIEQAHPRGTRRWHDIGLVPMGDGRYVLGWKGRRALVWSREGGLERIDGPVDWRGQGRILPAFGPERAVALQHERRAPLVSPPAGVHTEAWEARRPDCRPFKPKVTHLAAMSPAARLACHGGRELTFEAWNPHREYGGTCPFGPPFSWMACWDYWLATGPGPSAGQMSYALAPWAKLDKRVQAWHGPVRVTGHFDDPAARRCPEAGWNGRMPPGWRRMTRADFVRECRRTFVVTEMRKIRD